MNLDAMMLVTAVRQKIKKARLGILLTYTIARIHYHLTLIPPGVPPNNAEKTPD